MSKFVALMCICFIFQIVNASWSNKNNDDDKKTSNKLTQNNLFIEHIWEKFKGAHDKNYVHAAEESYRFGLFKDRLDLIEKHNREFAMGEHTYTLGLNEFADWTVQEFRERMLGTRLNMTYNKRGGSVFTFKALPEHVKLPDNVDWRELGAVTEVKNQGQCGSCWSFSTTGAMEGAHYQLSKQLVSLSEQQLVDCSGKYHNQGCNGGLMDNAFEYIKQNGGIDTENSYRYQGKQGKCHFKKEAIAATCSGYVDVESGNENALRDAIATVGPVSVAIDVTEERFMLYKDGIFVDDTCSNQPDNLNHGVLVVGYATTSSDQTTTTTTTTTEEPETKHLRIIQLENSANDVKDYWIVKNSWGPKWGEKGYIRMARNLNNMCGIATTASYPLVKKND